MPRLYPLLLLLLTTACGKDAQTPEPESSLLGRWEYEHKERATYDEQNHLLERLTLLRSPGPFSGQSLTFTADTLYHKFSGLRSWMPYRRRADTLWAGPERWTIQQLTSSRLTLHQRTDYRFIVGSTARQREEYTIYYTR
ncbi:hypothetical protein [Hymenobacter tenuis]